MKFTIRDLFLVTMIVALVLGWWVDRSRLVAREKEWNECFRTALETLSLETSGEMAFRSPNGIWTVNRYRLESPHGTNPEDFADDGAGDPL